MAFGMVVAKEEVTVIVGNTQDGGGNGQESSHGSNDEEREMGREKELVMEMVAHVESLMGRIGRWKATTWWF